MLGVTRLLCGTATPGDALRFGRQSGQLPPHLLHYSQDKEYVGELTTEEALRVIDDLAQFGAPVILFSGGEPLLRPDLFQLIRYAKDKGIRGVLSTNGTLITREVVRQLKEFGLSYVGVSIDGPEPVHDKFRGKKGAFQEALQGIRNCLTEDIRVGVRMTLTKYNHEHIDDVFRLLEEEGIPRACFYHLAYAGRGERLQEKHRVDLAGEETRVVVDKIFDFAQDLHRRGISKDILTVDNHTDGVYLYLRARCEQPERAE